MVIDVILSPSIMKKHQNNEIRAKNLALARENYGKTRDSSVSGEIR